MEEEKSLIKIVTRFINLEPILGGFIYYALGVGIARYLGFNVDWAKYITGQLAITVLQFCTILLQAYFEITSIDIRKYVLEKIGENLQPKSVVDLQRILLFLALSLFLISSVFMVIILLSISEINQTVLFIILLIAGIILYVIPPVTLVHSAFGVILEAFIVACLFPALAYTLQGHAPHRMILFISIPMFLLFISMKSVASLRRYGIDSKYHIKTIATRLGWEKCINIHNYLIVFSFVLLGINLLLDLPLRIILPGMVTFPAGIIQIILINRIYDGKKPNWQLLRITAITTSLITPYLITYALWIG